MKIGNDSLARWFGFAGLALISLICVGCGTPPPEIVPAGGTLLIGGAPLAAAEVRFVPMQDGLDGNYMSGGVTDADGKFSLTLANGKPGVTIGRHKVLVMDGPLPEEARGMSEEAQIAAVQYMNTVKVRAPLRYGNLVESPIIVEVTKEQLDYQIEITK